MFNKTKAPKAQTKREPSMAPSVLGPTLKFIGGELSSEEDLIIEGTVEGTIAHQNNQITIGTTGKVKADVHARVIIVEGAMQGDMQGDEAVHIRSTARVTGNIISPRISVADGASFEGSLKTAQESIPTELRAERKRPLMTEFAGGVGVEARRRRASQDGDEFDHSGEPRQVTR